MIEVCDLELKGVKHIKLSSFEDERGFFTENYRQPLYEQHGIEAVFIQDNLSVSKKGTIRGMHFQSEPGQAKLVSCIVGRIYDVFVDIRPNSPTFGKWGALEMDAERQEQIFIPEGFAHGFATLSDKAYVLYKVSSLFHPETEKTFYYEDPTIKIEWPFSDPILSERDRRAPSFQEVVTFV